MKLSEVFYEAACRTSERSDSGGLTCARVVQVSEGRQAEFALDTYSDLMAATGEVCRECAKKEVPCSEEVHAFAAEVGWHPKDFRTFMLLMASEAVND